MEQPRFKATWRGQVIGWYDTAAEAQAAIDQEGDETMTPTERRIKRLWQAGRTSQEIAADIGLNEAMVRAILDDLNL